MRNKGARKIRIRIKTTRAFLAHRGRAIWVISGEGLFGGPSNASKTNEPAERGRNLEERSGGGAPSQRTKCAFGPPAIGQCSAASRSTVPPPSSARGLSRPFLWLHTAFSCSARLSLSSSPLQGRVPCQYKHMLTGTPAFKLTPKRASSLDSPLARTRPAAESTEAPRITGQPIYGYDVLVLLRGVAKWKTSSDGIAPQSRSFSDTLQGGPLGLSASSRRCLLFFSSFFCHWLSDQKPDVVLRRTNTKPARTGQEGKARPRK